MVSANRVHEPEGRDHAAEGAEDDEPCFEAAFGVGDFVFLGWRRASGGGVFRVLGSWGRSGLVGGVRWWGSLACLRRRGWLEWSGDGVVGG